MAFATEIEIYTLHFAEVIQLSMHSSNICICSPE